jgi:hypothetical protein
MNGRFTDWVVVLLAPVLLSTVSCAGSGHDQTDKATQGYASPQAVFNAYQEARMNREDRNLFSLLTPEAQNDAVFESFFACMEQGSKEMGPIVPQYVDLATLGDDYEKQYKKKHGIDLAKFRAEHEHDRTFVAPPPHDDQLWRDVVAAHIKDKAGFFEAVAKHFDERDAKRHEEAPVSPLGELEQVVVHDDMATGHAKMTILRRPGESPPKSEKPSVYEKPFKFRRLNGGWLLDSL